MTSNHVVYLFRVFLVAALATAGTFVAATPALAQEGDTKKAQSTRNGILPTTICAEWNGFLGGMHNILEHVNRAASPRTLKTTMFDINAAAQSTTGFSMDAASQLDVLVDSLTGWELNSYGRVCTQMVDGSAGELDGRIVYYKPSSTAGSFDFAVAMPFESSKAGNLFAQFNSYQPSLNPAEASNVVLNWVQLTNSSSSLQTGTVVTFDLLGAEIGSTGVAIPANSRRDILVPGITPSMVGLVKWIPTNQSLAAFTMRIVRYYYDNPTAAESFNGAVQLEGASGSQQLLTVPVDAFPRTTVVLEVSNTTDAATTFTVVISADTGATASTQQYALPARGTHHILLNEVLDAIPSLAGVATIKASTSANVLVSALHYARATRGSIATSFAIPAQQPLGQKLTGSFNTFLGQACVLYLTNPTSNDVSTSLSSAHSDGSPIFESTETVPAHGLLYLDICFTDLPADYGVLTVVPAQPDTIIATVVREGTLYRFATPVRQ